jgi:hypothetical protein
MLPPKEKIAAVVKEVQKILRITDIEVFYYHCSDAEMLKHTGDVKNLGYFDYNIRRNCVDIFLNADMADNEKEWYDTIVHELYHVVTMPYRNRVLEIFPFVDEKIRGEIRRDNEDYYEAMVDNLTRIFCKIYPVTNFTCEVISDDEDDKKEQEASGL